MRVVAALAVAAFLWLGTAAAGGPDRATAPVFREQPEAMARLGRLLFYDRVLSGTYRVSCATCHHHDRASSNGFALREVAVPVRDDAAVGGVAVWERFAVAPRHAPALFNLGAEQFSRLFVDGRVARVGHRAFLSPAGTDLPQGLRDVLAVQALFPTVAAGELAGTVDEEGRPVGRRAVPDLWSAMAERVRRVNGYGAPFQAAFDDVRGSQDITIVHIANAISAFVGSEWRADASPYDAFLRDGTALPATAERGRLLFEGRAKCASCHAGWFQTDHEFHVVATPFWPFDADLGRVPPQAAEGRSAVTGRAADRQALRTPSLRNIVRTGPWGHAGSHADLRAFLRDHADPQAGARRWLDGRDAPMEERRALFAVAARHAMPQVVLDEADLDALLAFLAALTDERSLRGRLGAPDEVPSALALD